MSKVILISIVFGIFLVCSCQEENPYDSAVDETNSNHLTSSQLHLKPDLPVADYVVNLFEDSKGRIWVGTMTKGAIMLENDSLTYLTKSDGLAENTVVSVMEDTEGNIWFGSHNGVVKFDGEFYKYFGEKEGVYGAGAKFFMDSKNQLWLATNKGVFTYNGVFFRQFDLPIPDFDKISYKWEIGKIWAIHEDSLGNLWFGTDGYGVYKYDGDSFESYNVSNGLPSNVVSAIASDKEGKVWFGCLSYDYPNYQNIGGLSYFKNGNIERVNLPTEVENKDIYTVASDRDGTIWISVLGAGVIQIINGQFKLYQSTNREDLISSYAMQSFLENGQGQKWLGFSGGLFQLQGDSIIHFGKNSFKSN